jgi:hypothetical protein
MQMALHEVDPADLLRLTLQAVHERSPPVGHCHIAFRAGLLMRTDGKLKADTRKGQVAILESDDGFNSVQWFERMPVESGSQTFALKKEPEVDQLIFESEARVEWVDQSRRILRIFFPEVS